MAKQPRLLVFDLLEAFAREPDMDVRLERHHERDQWTCPLMFNSTGPTKPWLSGGIHRSLESEHTASKSPTVLIAWSGSDRRTRSPSNRA